MVFDRPHEYDKSPFLKIYSLESFFKNLRICGRKRRLRVNRRCNRRKSLCFRKYPCGRPGSRGGAVVIALASHQCVPGSIPGPGVICGLSLLLVLALASRVFSPVFLPPQKSTFLNSNSIGNSRATGWSVICTVMCYPRLTKSIYLFIYLLKVALQSLSIQKRFSV